jgi:hypothetical protein
MSALQTTPPTPAAAAVPADWTDADEQDYRRTEREMEKHAQSYFKFVSLLLHVRDARLYRRNYRSLGDYCKDRWNFGHTSAYRHLAAAEAVAAIESAFPALPAPTHERQVRPLVGLAPETAVEVYASAVEASGGAAPTGAAVAVAAAPLRAKLHRPKDDVAKAKADGIIPATAAVVVVEPDPDAAADDEPAIPVELSDADWLAALPARARLAPDVRERFDAEALMYRAILAARLTFRGVFTKAKNKAVRAARGHIGPYTARMSKALRQPNPERWLACEECGGTGRMQLVGNCAACHSHGYHV